MIRRISVTLVLVALVGCSSPPHPSPTEADPPIAASEHRPPVQQAYSFPEVIAFGPEDQTGITVQKFPTLHWFLSPLTPLPIHFILMDRRPGHLAVDLELRPPTRPGIQQIQLREHNIVLEFDVVYRWYVTVIRDPGDRSRDIVAGATIERSHKDLFFIGDGPTCDEGAVYFYAKSGIWYDAFACVTELIQTNPKDRTLRDLRSNLLGRRILVYLP
jgi:hypothetical protein